MIARQFYLLKLFISLKAVHTIGIVTTREMRVAHSLTDLHSQQSEAMGQDDDERNKKQSLA